VYRRVLAAADDHSGASQGEGWVGGVGRQSGGKIVRCSALRARRICVCAGTGRGGASLVGGTVSFLGLSLSLSLSLSPSLFLFLSYLHSLLHSFPISLYPSLPPSLPLSPSLSHTHTLSQVAISSIGLLTNLKALLQSTADTHSPLTGVQLMAQKVKTLAVMGGKYPTSHSSPGCNLCGCYNIANAESAATAAAASAFVFEHVPSEVLRPPFRLLRLFGGLCTCFPKRSRSRFLKRVATGEVHGRPTLRGGEVEEVHILPQRRREPSEHHVDEEKEAAVDLRLVARR